MTNHSVNSIIVLLGSNRCGKSSITVRSISSEFDPSIERTNSEKVYLKQIDLESNCVKLIIYEEPDNDSFKIHPTIMCRAAVVILFVFSLTDRDSFERLSDWFSLVNANVKEMPILFVVGNKNDLVEERKVESEQAELYAKEIGAFYYEVSAKTGSGIEELFNRVAEESYNKLIHENNEQPSINLSNNDSHNNSKCT